MAYLYKRGKTWYYRISAFTSDRKRKPINKGGFRTRKEAGIAAALIEAQMIKHGGPENQTITFQQYFSNWININKLGRYSESTDNKYKVTLRLIKKYFGDTKLKDVTKQEYQQMLDDYSTRKIDADGNKILRAKTTVQDRNIHIRAAVLDAIDDGLLHRDFTRKVIFRGNTSAEEDVKFLELDEAEKIKELSLQKASVFAISYATISFAILTGARYGEIVGMTWDCVDFEKHQLTINKQFDYQKRTGFKKTKTPSSVRTISMSSDVISLLRKIKSEQNISFMKQGYRNDLNLVFINNRHEVPSNNSANKSLRKLLEQINASNRKLGMHGLRHTHASVLFSKGTNLDYVSERLGHKNTTVTQKIYLHMLHDRREEEDKKAMEILDEL